MHHALTCRIALLCGIVLVACDQAGGQPASNTPANESAQTTDKRQARRAELDAEFSKMLSGATLEGSYTNTAKDRDPTKLSREKYTLGDVKKLKGDLWLIPARIQYREHDVTLPLVFPVRWAGDTPVIVVDNVGLPGFGTVSARVMFFADHYAGYWKHGKSGGHLFGVIRHDEANHDQANETGKIDASDPSRDSPAGEEQQKQSSQQ
jgi:hypothetical protein